MSDLDQRLTIVLLLHNCARWVGRTLDHLIALHLPVIAVDNASSDGTRDVVRSYPGVELVALTTNIGAAGRNVGVEHARTPYVALCDDDGWYEREGLETAVDIFERHPDVGLINARIVVGPEEYPDPISIEMEASPLVDHHPLPGTRLLSFMGGACVVRRAAYLAVGGFDVRFFIGGEEETLAWPLARAGWEMRYVPEVLMHHHPSLANYTRIRRFGIRNTLWNAWLHRRPASALRYSLFILASSPKDRDLVRGLALALRGLPWVLRRRAPVDARLDGELRMLEERRFRAWRAVSDTA
jgi:GT2 family glycosyltransferase